MTTCAPPGAPVWLYDSPNKGRKLRYTWELVRVEDDLVCVNTARANPLVASGLERGHVDELTGYSSVRREVARGQSRLDFALSVDGGPTCYVEVKTVTLRSGARECAFPDSVTARGLRHLGELVEIVQQGERAVMLFVCGRSPTDVIRPAFEIDPEYAAALVEAKARGVEILGYRMDISTEGLELGERIPVVTTP